MLVLSPIDTREFLPGELLGELSGWAERFEQVDPNRMTEAAFARRLHDYNPEVLVTGWKALPLPEKLPPGLRYHCHLCGTVRDIVRREHIEQGLLVTNWGGSIARVVAECALFHTLAALRRATEWTLAMHVEGGWKTREAETASLFGRRVGLHGFGHVAREYLNLIAPFGPKVSVFAPDVDAAMEKRHGVKKAESLEALFAQNDIVIELAPLNAETESIITERLLRLIPEGGVFVNLGRGRVVDEGGLVRVAQEGKIFFGLDVFALEPLASDHPLRGLRNVNLTPHLGGPTTDRRRDAGAFGLANLRAYAAGAPLLALVTPSVYDLSS